MDFMWQAIYKDGEVLSQYNDDGTVNKYTDIKRRELAMFVLLQVNRDDELNWKTKPHYVLHFENPKVQRLICRLRTAMPLLQIGPASEKKLERVWLVGMQWLHQGRCLKKLAFIFEDGHIEEKDDFTVEGQWHYTINFRLEDRLDGDLQV